MIMGIPVGRFGGDFPGVEFWGCGGLRRVEDITRVRKQLTRASGDGRASRLRQNQFLGIPTCHDTATCHDMP